MPEEFEDSGASAASIAQLRKTNLLSQLVDIWGDVPVPLLRRLDLRRSLYGYIGTEDRTMSPLLPPGTFIQIDAKQTRVQKGPVSTGSAQSQFARPIYFLDIRTGYACGWCQIDNGILTTNLDCSATRGHPLCARAYRILTELGGECFVAELCEGSEVPTAQLSIKLLRRALGPEIANRLQDELKAVITVGNLEFVHAGVAPHN